MTGNQTNAKNDALQFELEVNKTLELFEEKESEHNWEKFDNALNQLIEITSKGVSHYEKSYIAGIKSLRCPIQNSVLTTRSKLSGTAIELVEEIAKALGSRFVSISEIFVPSILKLFNRTNKVFIKRASKCLGTIIHETKSSNLMPTFKEAMQSHNKQMRTCVAEMVLAMLENNVNGLNVYIDALESIIRVGATDAEEAVRIASKKSFDIYKINFHFKLDNFVAGLSVNAKKVLGIKDQQQTLHQPVLFTSTKNNRNQHINLTTETSSLLLNNRNATFTDDLKLPSSSSSSSLSTFNTNKLRLTSSKPTRMLTSSPTIVRKRSKSSSSTAEDNVISIDDKQKAINSRVLSNIKHRKHNVSQTMHTTAAPGSTNVTTTRSLKPITKKTSSSSLHNKNKSAPTFKEENKPPIKLNTSESSKATILTHDNIKLSIAVTATDEYIGHSLAYYLLYYHSHDISAFRAIAKQQNEKHVQDLKDLGAEVHLIDYDEVSTLEKAFSGNLDVVIFVTESDEKRVQFAEITIQTFKKTKINHVGMISSIGADSHFECLKVYKEIEDILKQSIKKFCVIRLGLFYENLLFYKPMIDEDGKIKLTLNPKQHKFAPIDLNYIGKAMLILIMALSHMDQQQLILSASSSDDITKNTEEQKSFILTFTGHENLSCEEIVKKFNEIIGKNITYEEISRDDLKKYLYSLIERNGDGGGEQLLINKIYIDTFLDLLDWIKQGNAVISDDLQRIIGHPGESIDKFLKRNSKYFKQ